MQSRKARYAPSSVISVPPKSTESLICRPPRPFGASCPLAARQRLEWQVAVIGTAAMRHVAPISPQSPSVLPFRRDQGAHAAVWRLAENCAGSGGGALAVRQRRTDRGRPLLRIGPAANGIPVVHPRRQRTEPHCVAEQRPNAASSAPRRRIKDR